MKQHRAAALTERFNKPDRHRCESTYLSTFTFAISSLCGKVLTVPFDDTVVHIIAHHGKSFIHNFLSWTSIRPLYFEFFPELEELEELEEPKKPPKI
ncbi:hypothetical protein INR49_024518 [Caranx melampygus]|nr:hypothetical protein INR49_024518 [Caranx melampygus]